MKPRACMKVIQITLKQLFFSSFFLRFTGIHVRGKIHDHGAGAIFNFW